MTYPMFSSVKLASLEHLYVAGRAVKESLLGAGGLSGLAKGFKNPIANTIRGFRKAGVGGNLLILGMMGPGAYYTVTDPNIGPVQKAGKMTGILLPAYTLGHGAIGSNAPGMLGAEVLGGGMLIHKGVLETAGEQVDKLFGWGGNH